MKINKTAVLILNYNNSTDTIECLESLIQSKDKDYDVFILDNNSKKTYVDELVNWITKKFQSFRNLNSSLSINTNKILIQEHIFLDKHIYLLLNDENYGFAKGNNFLYKFASSIYSYDHYLLLNNDTKVTPFFLSKLLVTSYKDSNIAAVSCIITDYFNHNNSTFGGYISFLKGSGYFYTKSTNKRITFLSGCLMLIKASIIEEFGLFDENYFLYLEDVDLSLKYLRNGKKLALNQEVVIYHKESRSTGKRSDLTVYYNVRNRLYFTYKNQKNFFLKISFYLFFISSRFIKLVFQPSLLKIYKKSIKDFYNRNLGKQTI